MHRIALLLLLSSLLCCTGVRKNSPGTIVLRDGWRIQSSEKVKLPGREISIASFNDTSWYTGHVPSTIMATLIENGLYQDIFKGDNISKADKKQFGKSWWYRKNFYLADLEKDQHVFLHFDGISYSASVWLNGKLIASRDSVSGAFRRFDFDVTSLLTEKENTIAVEIFKREPGDFGIGFVDWNPVPPDESMGIWREVSLVVTGTVRIQNPTVESTVNTETLDEADLVVKTELVNNSDAEVTGILEGKIETTAFSFPVTLLPRETRMLALSGKEIASLHIKNPRLWWCNNLGNPNLYNLHLSFEKSNVVMDTSGVTFGIRQIEEYRDEHGYKGYKLNGKKVLIKGAGWTDEIFLRDTDASNEAQVQYVKHMNLNTIRLENVWGKSQNLYDLCDRYGILVMVGWSCQWEWENYVGKACDDFGGIQTPEEMKLMVRSLTDQVKWLRHHPSIFTWFVGSDKLPKPELEKQYSDVIKKNDNRTYLAAASLKESTLSGSTGMKMNGPYEYVAPDYWYEDTSNGGAFGFNSETTPGPQLPVKESVLKMIPADQLWPAGRMWDFHCTSAAEAFNTLAVFNHAMDNRYGKPGTLDEYLMKADLMQFEAMKAMFEAFRVNQGNATGIIQWKLNSAWPSFYWQLYDYYLLPTASYYATRKANQPLQLMYAWSKNRIYAVNESPSNYNDYKTLVRVFSKEGKELLHQTIATKLASLKTDDLGSLPIYKETVFLSLELMDEHGNRVADNFYWLSEKKDAFDWKKTEWTHTPLKSFADFKSLTDLSPADVAVSFAISEKKGTSSIVVTLDNKSSSIAFFNTLTLVNEKGEQLFPVLWDDNYFSILPGSAKQLTGTFKQLKGAGAISLILRGVNVSEKKREVSKAR